MNGTRELTFASPSFVKRLRGMLGVDFYRLFHTPMFYIFLGIAAIIPALVSMGGGEDGTMYTTMWNIIAADSPLYIINNIAEYANMNMVFIFGGIMVSIFIGHDYKSGYVKQLFTTHAKKQDYMLSKTLISAFSMACMCIAYLIGGTISGTLTGLSMEVNVGSLLIAILGKMIMSLGWASLYTFINTLPLYFRQLQRITRLSYCRPLTARLQSGRLTFALHGPPSLFHPAFGWVCALFRWLSSRGIPWFHLVFRNLDI